MTLILLICLWLVVLALLICAVPIVEVMTAPDYTENLYPN